MYKDNEQCRNNTYPALDWLVSILLVSIYESQSVFLRNLGEKNEVDVNIPALKCSYIGDYEMLCALV